MALVLHVLHVAGSTVGFVGSNHLLLRARIEVAVMTLAAGSARRDAINWLLRCVAA